MLRIEGLTKRYGQLLAVDDVALAVPPGRLVGFVGPNGAGKSTTMRSIFGLVAPDAGTITWDGTVVGRDHLRRFGYMPEQRGLYPKMGVGEQVAYFAQLKGIGRRQARKRADELLGSLGLSDRAGDPLEKLSHGNQQRVQLAASLANDPDLLVLDEPFSGLDPVAVETLQQVLLERMAEGAGVLFSSHQLDLVERVCDEIFVIVGGRVRAAGTVREVRSQGARPQVSVEVDGPLASVVERLAGFPVLSATEFASRATTGRTASVTVAVGSDADVGEVLERCRLVGPVTRMDYDSPSLADRFATIVAAAEAESAADPETDRGPSGLGSVDQMVAGREAG